MNTCLILKGLSCSVCGQKLEQCNSVARDVWSEEYREPESASGLLPSLPASAPSAGLCVCDDDCPFRCPFLAKLVGLRVGGLELLVVEDFQ